ncbi:MAG: RloB family protein [Treponema sp.]|nr:RloB family protein [Treponema sp.]
MGLKKAGYIPKKRNAITRKRKSIIVISPEGKNKTEILYFKKFNSDKIKIHFSKGGATHPEGLVSELIRELKEMDFQPELGDKAYCVLDSDFVENKNEQIAKAEKKAKLKNIDLIVSGPCFEIWYLCHFSHSTKQYFSNEEVIKELSRYIPGYTKSKEGIFELLLQRQGRAVENAKKLEKYNICNDKKIHTVEFAPSTEVYKIIENIKTVEAKK